MAGATLNIAAIIAGSFVTASGVACLFLANYQYMEMQIRGQ
jgi:hypothetical protein